MAGEFARLVSGPQLERAVENTLRTWLGAYLGEVLAQAGHGRDDLPEPDDMTRASSLQWPTESQFALVVVVSPGTEGDAVRHGDGYDATWTIRATILANLPSAPTERVVAREAAQFYAAAAGAALTSKGIELEGAAVLWRGESYGELDERDARTLVGGQARVVVTVENARPLWDGPETPPVRPIDPNTGEPTGEPPPRDEGTPRDTWDTATTTIRKVPVGE